MAINLGEEDTLVVTRTATLPVRNIKAFQLATAE